MRKKGQLEDYESVYNDLYSYLWGEGPTSITPTEAPESPSKSLSPTSIDAASRNAISSLDPSMQPLALAFMERASQAGLNLTITNGYRSKDLQSKLYEQGRSQPGAVVTNAKPGFSKHNFGIAIDVAPVKDGKPYWPEDNELWDKIGEIGESVGLRWGGKDKFKDRPHFDHPDISMKDVLTGKVKTKYSGQEYYITKMAERKNKERQIRLMKLKLLV